MRNTFGSVINTLSILMQHLISWFYKFLIASQNKVLKRENKFKIFFGLFWTNLDKDDNSFSLAIFCCSTWIWTWHRRDNRGDQLCIQLLVVLKLWRKYRVIFKVYYHFKVYFRCLAISQKIRNIGLSKVPGWQKTR